MEELSTARLYVLRTTYLLIGLAIGAQIWPLILPLWLTHQLDSATAETMKACLMGVVLVPLVLPWGYVIRHYVRAPGDRWRARAATAAVNHRELVRP